MRLVLFSYSKHYHIMQLAYRHALTAFDNITNVTVIWDDMYDNKQPTIPFDADVITHSSLDFLAIERHGWLRQQYVKLNLHKLFDDEQWIVLDADVILKTKKSFSNKEIYTDSKDHYEPYFKFIKHAFGIDKNNSPSYMTHFALFERKVLASIEQFILNKHSKDLILVYKEYLDIQPPACPGFSEFEIYGLFVERILQEKYHYQHTKLKIIWLIILLNITMMLMIYYWKVMTTTFQWNFGKQRKLFSTNLVDINNVILYTIFLRRYHGN